MALPSSGPISFSSINVELGKNSTDQISLNDSDVRTLFGVASGAISMNDGYGKSAVPSDTLVFLGPFESGNEAAYFNNIVGSTDFLPGGPMPNDVCWVIYSDFGSDESAQAFSGDTLTIDNFCGGPDLGTTPVWDKLIKIEIMGTDGNVLGSYNRADLVPFQNAFGTSHYIPMASLGLLSNGVPTQPAAEGGVSNANYTPPAGQLHLRWTFSTL